MEPYSLILVAILPTKKDLEIARVLGWYRIPFRFAPKVLNVDYLAFYQPAGSLGKPNGGMIRYFAKVKGVELVLRRELFREEPDHPRADEEYYKIQIGSILEKQPPITIEKYKRLTFLYTTTEYFVPAKTVSDLVVQSGEREILWTAIREQANQASEYSKTAEKQPVLDEDWMQFFMLDEGTISELFNAQEDR